MIGLDTNILVRYLTQDDPVQTEKVNQLIEKQLTPEQPGHITVITLVELVWVLESCYGQAKDATVLRRSRTDQVAGDNNQIYHDVCLRQKCSLIGQQSKEVVYLSYKYAM